jgi:hypothetical protein
VDAFLIIHGFTTRFFKNPTLPDYDVSIPDLMAKEEESVCKPETMNLVAVVVLVVKYL